MTLRAKAKSASTVGRLKNRRSAPAPIEDDIYRLITDAILTKQIRPGARLKEAVLADQFGVNRLRVHRALQRLAELQIVAFRFNQGATVGKPSVEEAKAVFRTRRVLEAEAVHAVMGRADAAAYSRLRAFVKNEEAAFHLSAPGVVALSSRFHLLVAELCGNTVLARILDQLVHRCVLIQALYERVGQSTICLTHEHMQLVDFMEAGDTEAALAALAHHFDHIEASLDYDAPAAIDQRLAASVG